MNMNPTRALDIIPRYGIRDDEMTKPAVVLYDWNGDDENTVHVAQLLPKALREAAQLELDSYEDMFRPRWHGIGRSAGKAILGVVLGACVAIFVCALVYEPTTTGGEPGGLPVDVAQH